jgi:hypothetical protein
MKISNLSVLATLLAACQATPETHARVAADEQRSISVSVLLAELPAAKLAELSKERTANGVVRAGFAEALLERAGTDATLCCRPRLVLGSGSEGEFSVSEHTSYTQDFEDGADGRPREIRGTLDEGFWIHARPTATTVDGESAIELDLALRLTKVLRPIRTATITLRGTGLQVTVELPEIVERRSAAEAVLRAGEGLLVDFAGAAPDGRVTVAVVTAAFVDRPREASFRTCVEGVSAAVTYR